jgi:hypothetical protein
VNESQAHWGLLRDGKKAEEKYKRFISVSKNLDIKVLVYKAVSFNIGTWSITFHHMVPW